MKKYVSNMEADYQNICTYTYNSRIAEVMEEKRCGHDWE